MCFVERDIMLPWLSQSRLATSTKKTGHLRQRVVKLYEVPASLEFPWPKMFTPCLEPVDKLQTLPLDKFA